MQMEHNYISLYKWYLLAQLLYGDHWVVAYSRTIPDRRNYYGQVVVDAVHGTLILHQCLQASGIRAVYGERCCKKEKRYKYTDTLLYII